MQIKALLSSAWRMDCRLQDMIKSHCLTRMETRLQENSMLENLSRKVLRCANSMW